MIVGAWASMEQSSSDESAFIRHANTITHVYPTNGGWWDGSGSFVQVDHRLNWSWPKSLPALAQKRNIKYMPVIGCTAPLELLDKPGAWQAAIDAMLNIATTRFDAPWYGVMLDIEGPRSPYREKLNSFLSLVCDELHNEGLMVAGWFWNCLSNEGHEHPMCDAATDWGHYGEIFDFVHVGEAFYQDFTPAKELSIAPMWWIKDGLQRMLDEGVPPRKIVMDLRLAERYSPSDVVDDTMWIPYSIAAQMVADAGVKLEWVDHLPSGAAHPEAERSGAMQEWKADLSGMERIWIEDERTTSVRLNLVSKYGLAGCAVFRPSLSNPTSWDAIARRFSQVSGYSHGVRGIFSIPGL